MMSAMRRRELLAGLLLLVPVAARAQTAPRPPIRARVIDITTTSGGVRVVMSAGADHGVVLGASGELMDRHGNLLAGSAFKVSAVTRRTCTAFVPHPMATVQQHNHARITP